MLTHNVVGEKNMQKLKRAAAALIGASVLTTVLAGCSEKVNPTPKWNTGTFVRSALSNQRGQIIELRCWSGEPACYYDVRFVGLSMTTDTHVIASDGPVSTEPLTVITYMREYELIDD
jgi:hypothetical protein